MFVVPPSYQAIQSILHLFTEICNLFLDDFAVEVAAGVGFAVK